jgi:pyruvate/2-oxoglutarate dehydrogenase complex dihydrolipoamide acyltransferase (E2) component
VQSIDQILLTRFLLGCVAAVVREIMVPVGDTDISVAAVAAVVGKNERDDPGQIALKCQYEQVAHESQMLAMARA